jgi:superfamily I DNA and/or RNA helicase
MPAIINLTNNFSTTHEREFWNEFSVLYKNTYSNNKETSVLLGNIVIESKELMDAIVIKKDAIIIIDFKEGGGEIKFKEKEIWTRNDGSEIKGGSYTNPYLQMRYYKFKLKEFLSSKKVELPDIDNANLDHINGVVLFKDKINFDRNTLPGNIKPWFHITDKINILEKLNSVTSRTINFSDNLISIIPSIFGNTNQSNAKANPNTVRNTKIVKYTATERILDYYICCLEQEDLKNLHLGAETQNGNINNQSKSYHLFPDSTNNFILNNKNDIVVTDPSITTFIKQENLNPNPRNLFLGSPLLAYVENNKTYIYPKYFCQLIINDNQLNSYKRINDDELNLNKYYLKRCGLSDREEIESICDEINNFKSYQEKENYLTNLTLKNKDTLNNIQFLYYSESSNITSNLLKELGEKGLMNNYNLKRLSETPAKYLINKDIVSKSDINYDLQKEVEIFSLNNSQENAVRKSLSKHFTVITGPPGTGKSQVVLNILANAVMQNKKVLFASNNNKAVDVVKNRFIDNIFSDTETDLSDTILRLGNVTEMKNTLIQLDKIINHINDGEYNIDIQLLNNSLNDLEELNNILYEKKEILNKTDKFLTVCTDIDNFDYSLQSDFFSNKVFTIDEKELDYNINELSRLSNKKELNIIEKLILFIYPKYYFNKYYSKLNEVKNCLPDLSKNYFDRVNNFTNYNILELVRHFEELKEIKRKEKIINTLKDFILGIDVESIFKNDLPTATKFLKMYKSQLENELNVLRSQRIELSREAFKNKLKYSLSNLRQEVVQNYKESYEILTDKNKKISNYPDFMRNFENNFETFINSLPIWTVTSLSIKNRIPLKTDLFDLLIIDEASQCDIPSMIPLFFRVKNVCIIGDDLQLKHISGLSLDEDFKIAEDCGVPQIGGRYTEESLFIYSLNICNKSNIDDIFLNEHYRSHVDIMNFCNKNFYIPKKARSMIHKTQDDSLIFPNQGIYWINVTSNNLSTKYKKNLSEIDKIIEIYKDLLSKNLNQNISYGIATPFRNQGDAIKHKLIKEKINDQRIEVLGDTVHKFQGDEKDVIFFSPVISFEATNGMKNFINYFSPQLLNVAISRGRSAVIIVGDKSECSNSGGLLSSLVNSSKLITNFN